MARGQKTTLVKTLRTTQDFTELLSLSELSTQMEVLSFLQNNLFDYQMNYFKSHLMTFEEMMTYIPEKDKGIYFKESQYREYKGKGQYLPYSEKYVREEMSGKNYGGSNYISTHYFLVNTIKKVFYHFNKKFVPKFKFSYKKGLLICEYHFVGKKITFERYAKCEMHDSHHVITVKFQMVSNLLCDFCNDNYLTNSHDCGGWYDTKNEKFKDIVDE